MKTLIIYATKYGSVEHAAQLLKSKLAGDVQLVNIIKEDVPPLEEFEIVILGGSIYVGKIQKKLSKYITKKLPQLLGKRIGLFICAGQKEEVRIKELETAFPTELYHHAVCKEVFGYEIHYEKMNFFEKKIIGSILGHKQSYSDLSETIIARFAKEVVC